MIRNVVWDEVKNKWLVSNRSISFPQILEKIINNEVLDIVDNNSTNHGNQKMLLVIINDYLHCVPFVTKEDTVFLKTIFRNRKLNKIYNQKQK